jgi:hypothetical protein
MLEVSTYDYPEMRKGGMYLHGGRGKQVLLNPMRGCKEDDDSPVPLRTPRM